MKSIASEAWEIEQQLERTSLHRPGFRIRVYHLAGTDTRSLRRMRRETPVDEWLPETDSLLIHYEFVGQQPMAEPMRPAMGYAPPQAAAFAPSSPERREELLQALGRAETLPGYDFVALKWFRDVYLPQAAPWAISEVERRRVLNDAIREQSIIVGKVANPVRPQFPTTTIRLNRASAQVQKIQLETGLMPAEDDSMREPA